MRTQDAIAGRNSHKMYHYFMYNREEFLAHYHKRSNVETAFSMIKPEFAVARYTDP